MMEQMQPSLTPLKFLILTFAGWISQRQLAVIEYLQDREPRAERAPGWEASSFH